MRRIFGISVTMILMAYVMASLLTLLITTTSVSAQIPGVPPGTPRGDVYIAENHAGRYTDPYMFNPFVPGVLVGYGLSQLGGNFLFYFDTTTGEWIPWVAATYPEYSMDFKTMKVYIRRGVTWSDGVPYTADDLVFQINLIKGNSRLSWHATVVAWVEDVYKEDDYTVVFKLKKPNPRFHYFLTAQIGMQLLAKHVWEKVEDPLAFKNYPPLTLGPAILKDVDPGGNWFLWERNENWWATKKYGWKMAPKYVLFIHYGPDDKEALAMMKHELESVRTWLPEVFEIVYKDPEMPKWLGGFYGKGAPYAWPYDACMKGPVFNVLRWPYNITEVRRALAFAIDIREIIEAFTGIDGSKPVVSPLPIIPRPATVKAYFKPLEPELIKLGYDPEVGWWKYDPTTAENLLKSAGFTKGADGKWRLPDGTPWTIKIMTFAEVELESQRLAYLVAEQWRRFGVEVTVEPTEWAVYSPRLMAAEWEVATYFPGCNFLPVDLGDIINRWHSKYGVPENPGLGWLYYSNFALYKFDKRPELDAILEELEMTHPDDPKAAELARKALLIWAEQLPWPQFFPVPFYTLNDRYVWEGFPEYPANYYTDPVYWWPHFTFIVLNIRPTGNVPTSEAFTPPRPQLRLPHEIPIKIEITKTETTTVTTTAAAATVTVTTTSTTISTTTRTEISTTTAISTVTSEVAVPTMDVASVAGAGIVALIIGVAVGWFVGSKRKT